MGAWWEELLAAGAGVGAGLLTANPMVGLGVWQGSRSVLDALTPEEQAGQASKQPGNNPYGIGTAGHQARIGLARENVRTNFAGAERSATAGTAARGMLGSGAEIAANNSIASARAKALTQATGAIDAQEGQLADDWNRWNTDITMRRDQANNQAWGNAAMGVGLLGARFAPEIINGFQGSPSQPVRPKGLLYDGGLA